MNKNEKSPITTRVLPTYLGPLVLFVDVTLAGVLWFGRDFILGPGQDKNAAIAAAFIAFSGLVVFMFFRNLSRKVF